MTVVASSLGGVRPNEVAYRRPSDPPMISEAALVWKEDKRLPLLQDLCRIAREAIPQDESGDQLQ
ncbi:hypothetical protein GT019_28340 [Paenibacillus sp. T1]|uniref:LysR substrate-binding domain-containing protein n=1 Tax=Paenibacillus glycinis TaxID=2697035 RepID=A0ABW9XYL2_9BACL|nr:hypothetical protein [Paenibacillus glycinis]